MAFKILSGLPVISLAEIASSPLSQIGCFEVRKFHANVGLGVARWPNFARTGTMSSHGSTSPYQRSCSQNFDRKQSSRVTHSIILRASSVKSANSQFSAHSSSRQLSRL